MDKSWISWEGKVPPLRGSGPWAKSPWSFASLRTILASWADREEGRFILFAPCLIAYGILLWFRLLAPLPWQVPLLVLATIGGVWWVSTRRRQEGVRLVARALFFVALGIALISVRTALTTAPVVAPGSKPYTVTGVLEKAEIRSEDRRYTIRVRSLEGSGATPYRVRVVWRGEPGEAAPGDLIRVRAALSPPPGPALPGGYDFSRSMRYQKIGGVGFSYHAPEVLRTGGFGFKARTERLRDRVAARGQQVIGGDEGAVAAALLTGKRERIPEDRLDDLRDAGLAHLLAISGLHMGLVCGLLFWVSRFLLSRSEVLALRYPIKKWAAVAALLGGAFYLLLSGGAWSAQRAFIMAAIVFGAVLVDRRGISLRNAALAALVILAYRPEAVMDPGFQMSFAAVVTLIAAFSWWEERRSREHGQGSIAAAGRFLGGLMMTSFLAGIATGPFAAFHFGRVATFGLLGNMLAMPIITLAVMPALVLSLFLMPVGLDGPVLFLVGEGIGAVLGIARFTAGLPGAAHLLPALSPWSIIVAATGIFMAALLSAPWRLAGLALLLVAAPLIGPVPEPDVFISRNLRNIGIQTNDREKPLLLLSQRRDRFSAEAWLQAIGAVPDVSRQGRIGNCKDSVCSVVLPRGGKLAVTTHRSQLREACSRHTVVVLRANLGADDVARCKALLIGLDGSGYHPPASLHHKRGQWRLVKASGP